MWTNFHYEVKIENINIRSQTRPSSGRIMLGTGNLRKEPKVKAGSELSN